VLEGESRGDDRVRRVDIHANQHKPVTPRAGRRSAGAAGRAARCTMGW
jgi:hypothetical protein